ncbi:hypothetical protein ACFLZZ_00220 [Nanoarchaeota archaeon]
MRIRKSYLEREGDAEKSEDTDNKHYAPEKEEYQKRESFDFFSKI